VDRGVCRDRNASQATGLSPPARVDGDRSSTRESATAPWIPARRARGAPRAAAGGRRGARISCCWAILQKAGPRQEKHSGLVDPGNSWVVLAPPVSFRVRSPALPAHHVRRAGRQQSLENPGFSRSKRLSSAWAIRRVVVHGLVFKRPRSRAAAAGSIRGQRRAGFCSRLLFGLRAAVGRNRNPPSRGEQSAKRRCRRPCGSGGFDADQLHLGAARSPPGDRPQRASGHKQADRLPREGVERRETSPRTPGRRRPTQRSSASWASPQPAGTGP